MNNPIKLEEYLQNGSNTNFTNLITAVSYENRGYLSVKAILDYFTIKKSILILFGKNYLNAELKKKWDTQKKLLSDLFNERGMEYIEVKCNPVFFNNSIDEIKNITKSEFPNMINITTLPKNYILRLAKEFDKDKNIFLYYRSEYKEPNEQELNIGIERITPIEGFEGIRELTAEDLLVLILGYEGHRALSFLSKFSPYKILPLISIPNDGNKEIDDKFYNNVIKCNWSLLRKHNVLKRSDGQFFTISSLNHLNFSMELKDIINSYKNKDIDICISPMGTKAQTLGLYLYWRGCQNAQIIYSVPIKRFDMTITKTTIKDIPTIPLNKRPDTNGRIGEAWIYKLPSEK